jgi:large subunit ribosomal protein L24
MFARIKKDDLVTILSGRDKGKSGHVISVDQKGEQILVKGLALVTCHQKARRQGEKSKISHEESYLPFGKVMPICPSCKKPCRVQMHSMKGDKKGRICHRCKEAF